VVLSTTRGVVTQAGAGARPVGISQRGTRRSEYVDTSGKAAAVNEPIMFFDEGEECWLEIAGTVAVNALLKSDADGKGLAATADADWAGAVALGGGASGDLIPVKVQIVQRAS
jgi:hypothetical protein